MSSRWLCGLCLPVLAAAGSFSTADPGPSSPDRALITVRTLVIDALGTRTVDSDMARVPFGGTGLLIKKVPYGGPELSFRLAVTAGIPQEAGIAVNLSADIWSGDTSSVPPPSQVSHREEATVLAPESSYLLEIDHSETRDRRIMLSISARQASQDEDVAAPQPSSSGSVSFNVEVYRESHGVPDPLDTRAMSTMIGVAATYSSGVTIPGKSSKDPSRFVGLGISITPEKTRGNLVTLRSELTGADFVDTERKLLIPIKLLDIRTVASGERFDLTVELADPSPTQEPASGPAEVSKPPVTYHVSITPRVL